MSQIKWRQRLQEREEAQQAPRSQPPAKQAAIVPPVISQAPPEKLAANNPGPLTTAVQLTPPVVPPLRPYTEATGVQIAPGGQQHLPPGREPPVPPVLAGEGEGDGFNLDALMPGRG